MANRSLGEKLFFGNFLSFGERVMFLAHTNKHDSVLHVQHKLCTYDLYYNAEQCLVIVD